MNKLLKLSVLSYSMILLSGCGIQDETVTHELKTGVFVDSAVSGLNYKCSTKRSGTTNSKGEFVCQDGDSVEFFIGNNSIGSASVQSIITPQTLFANNKDAELNLAQLLQTLDKNHNPDDGITIDENIVKSLGNINFESTSFDEDIQIALGNDIVLVPEITAKEHLNSTLISYGLIKEEVTEDKKPVVAETNTTKTTETNTTTTVVTGGGPLTSPYTTPSTKPVVVKPTPSKPAPKPSTGGPLTSPYTSPGN